MERFLQAGWLEKNIVTLVNSQKKSGLRKINMAHMSVGPTLKHHSLSCKYLDIHILMQNSNSELKVENGNICYDYYFQSKEVHSSW